MRKIRRKVTVVAIFLTMAMCLSACGGSNSKLADGTYKCNIDTTIYYYYFELGGSFSVNGNTITRGDGQKYTYSINGNEIMLVGEDGSEWFYYFEKKSDKSYVIQSYQFALQ